MYYYHIMYHYHIIVSILKNINTLFYVSFLISFYIILITNHLRLSKLIIDPTNSLTVKDGG